MIARGGGHRRGAVRLFFCRPLSSSSRSVVRIGDVEKQIRPLDELSDAQRRKVPSGYLIHLRDDPTALSHLRWLLQKDRLGQDALLAGYGGAAAAHRRRLALAYAELAQRPVELLTLSRDTTEADLKQRRLLVRRREEAESGGGGGDHDGQVSARIAFQDQAPVRAALGGHLLILDGLQCAERNVLPTLNNLLENRELPLEDGRLLVSAERYRYLQEQQQQQQQTDSPMLQFLVPVHEDFRCLALLSVGGRGRHGLDPPVRSRFQIRRVDGPSTDRLYEQLLLANGGGGGADADLAKQLAVFATAMEESAAAVTAGSRETAAPALHFPVTTALSSILQAKTLFPEQPVVDLLTRAYPYAAGRVGGPNRWPAADASREAFGRACREVGILAKKRKKNAVSNNIAASCWCYELDRVERLPESRFNVRVHLRSLRPSSSSSSVWGSSSNETVTVTAPSGGKEILVNNGDGDRQQQLVATQGSRQALSAMMQEHAVGRDVLLLSPKGEGKNVLAAHFCATLGYQAHLFPLYKEMTASDLLLRRTSSGDWTESPLLTAARTGQVCIIDGVEKLSRETLATLQGFLTDREVELPDGTKFSSRKSSENNLIDGSAAMIHPSFRVIALASTSLSAKSSGRSAPPIWLSEEAISMFSTIPLPAPSRECLRDILRPQNAYSETELEKILDFHELLLETSEECGVEPLSVRSLLRLVQHGKVSDGHTLHDNICSCLLAELISPTQRATLESLLQTCGIQGSKNERANKRRQERAAAMEVNVTDNQLTIGDFQMDRLGAKNPELVPSPYWFDIPSHVQMIQTLLSEWSIGERSFLLLGNQGTGM